MKATAPPSAAKATAPPSAAKAATPPPTLGVKEREMKRLKRLEGQFKKLVVDTPTPTLKPSGAPSAFPTLVRSASPTACPARVHRQCPGSPSLIYNY